MKRCPSVLAVLGVQALACNIPPPAPAPPPQATSATATPAAPALSLPSAEPEPSASALPPPSPPPPASASAAPAVSSFERRCGWVDNPTPANWWLIDRDATWEIGLQGGHQADGDMPSFGGGWVETNGHYGYGCACMSVRVDGSSHRILVVRDAKGLPLARCKGDKGLPPHP